MSTFFIDDSLLLLYKLKEVLSEKGNISISENLANVVNAQKIILHLTLGECAIILLIFFRKEYQLFVYITPTQFNYQQKHYSKFGADYFPKNEIMFTTFKSLRETNFVHLPTRTITNSNAEC